MKFKINGMKELQQALNKAGKQIEKDVDSEIKRIANEILTSAISRVPADKGLLRGSAFIEKTEGGYVIGFSATYAPYQEFGAGPFTEIPTGYEAYAREFYVDGSGTTRPKPFLFPAFLSRRDKIVDELTLKLDAFTKSF